jgi:predicted transcriptional regulator
VIPVNHKDPMNFKKIDIDRMADLLNLSKKDIKKSIKKFDEDGLIEHGNTDTIKDGYRFTF